MDVLLHHLRPLMGHMLTSGDLNCFCDLLTEPTDHIQPTWLVFKLTLWLPSSSLTLQIVV